MQPFPSPFPTHRVPPVKRAGRRLAILFGVIVAGILLVIGGFWIYGRITPQHVVVIANDNDFAVEVDAGGKHVSLAPRATDWVRAHDGPLTVTATGAGFSDTATLELPATGWNTAGRTALYNVGGTAQLAIVSITYGATSSTTPPVQLLRDRLVLLPVGASGQIDEAFPKEVRTKGIGTMRQHVCHVDLAAKRVGCPGAFTD